MKEIKLCPECKGVGKRCCGTDAWIKPIIEQCPACKGMRFVLVDPDELVDISK